MYVLINEINRGPDECRRFALYACWKCLHNLMMMMIIIMLIKTCMEEIPIIRSLGVVKNVRITK